MAKELGRIGQRRYHISGMPTQFMEEFLRELQGIKGVEVYTEMADNDATVGAILFAVEMLMRQAEFHVEPASESAKDKEAAEFVESCMHDMERTWTDYLSEIMSFLVYGWSYHEIVYKRRVGKSSSPITNSKYNDGLIGWRKIPIRSQDTLYGWNYKDGTDDLIGMTQQPPPDFGQIFIPLEKALHFRTRSRKDNPEGRSILRTSYRAWYFKKRIEEIEGYGIERDLAGFPVLYAPADMNIWDTSDPEMVEVLARAEYIVSSIRRDAREGLVLPGGENGWKLELVTSGSRRQFDTNAILDRYNKSIATCVMADFLMLGHQAVGSFALADNKTSLFGLAIGTFLDVICEVFNKQAIPRLIDLNGEHFKGISDYPKMEHGDIEERDLIQAATFLEKMTGCGLLTPDEELEAEIRRMAGLPEKKTTDIPQEVQPGENGPKDLESKGVYKVTSILNQYQEGKITRDAAADMIRSIGYDEEKTNFYLNEADTARQNREKADKEKQEDEKDAREAEEAKKSLGR